VNDKHDGYKNSVHITSKSNTDQQKKGESQTPVQDERETYPPLARRDSHAMWRSYSQENDAGISQRRKKSSSMYWKQQNSKTRTRERCKRQATSTTKFKASKETWTKEEKKGKELRWGYPNGRTASSGTKERFGYQTTKEYEPLLLANITNPHNRDMAERQNYRTQQQTILVVQGKRRY